MPLADGSALRLTTAKYYTPSHKVIHELGIIPDVVVPITVEEDRAMQTQTHARRDWRSLNENQTASRILAMPDAAAGPRDGPSQGHLDLFHGAAMPGTRLAERTAEWRAMQGNVK